MRRSLNTMLDRTRELADKLSRAYSITLWQLLPPLQSDHDPCLFWPSSCFRRVPYRPPTSAVSDDQVELCMHKGKLKTLLNKFEEYLIVDHGLAETTVEGYTRSLSIALRRMRKFCPAVRDIKRHILWMHSEKYSYHHIVNTSLAIEHYCKLRGFVIRLGRPRKPNESSRIR